MASFLLIHYYISKVEGTMALVIYGIKNCNSMKKAFLFLEEHDLAYRFHDFKKEALDKETLTNICNIVSLDTLINTKGTTYKKLKEQGIKDITMEVIMQNPSVIKRPLIVCFRDNVIQKVVVGLQHLETLL